MALDRAVFGSFDRWKGGVSGQGSLLQRTGRGRMLRMLKRECRDHQYVLNVLDIQVPYRTVLGASKVDT